MHLKPVLWLVLGLLMTTCDLRSDEQVLRDALQGQLPASQPGEPTPGEPQPSESKRPKTASGKHAVALSSPKRERLDFPAEAWASRGNAAAFSRVTPFGDKGSLWLLVGDAEPVALTDADAYCPVPIRVTQTSVEFLDMPVSDPSKVYPPEPDTHPIRLLTVSRTGGTVDEIVSLGTADLVARSDEWTYAPAGAGHSALSTRTPLVGRGPAGVTKELHASRGQSIKDILVGERTLVWSTRVPGKTSVDPGLSQLWETALDANGSPSVADSPSYSAPEGPVHLARLGDTLFAVTTGTLTEFFGDATLSRWDGARSTFVPLVEGFDAGALGDLVATSDALCWSDGYGDHGLYCYRPATDQLIEVSRRVEPGGITAVAPFGLGIIWSEETKAADGGKTFVAVP